ncbi:MAG: OsmC family protein [Candidatus Limnocylindrales bacterium]
MPTHKTVELTHRGGMQFHAEPSSGHPQDFDTRDSNQGGSPVETILSALAACTAMDVISIARKKRQAIESYVIHASADQRDEYPQIFTDIVLVHEVTGAALSEAAIRRSIELSATKYCPVNAMLSAGATVVHHRYRIVSTGERAYEAEGEVIATGPYQRPDIIKR